MNVALCPEHLNIISICTGGGGLDLGIELAIPGARSVCMVEREAFAVAQLVSAMEAGYLAPAPVWSDARTFDGRRWRGCVDGLIGGIPCQPHSLAGRKRGSLDERDLWSPTRRIIVQSRAWFVLIENVSGMLSPGDDEVAGAERVWRDLRKLGFTVEGGLFKAAEVGASHERERLFILGVADTGYDERAAWTTRGEHESGSSVSEQSRGGSVDLADTSSQRRAPWISGPQRSDQEGIAGEPIHGCDALDNACRERWPAGRHDHAEHVGDEPHPAGELGLVNAIGPGCGHGRLHQQQHMADAHGDEPSTERRDAREVQGSAQGQGWAEHGSPLSGGCCLPTFPPGPGDVEGWQTVLKSTPELEPAFRRVADGLASRMDVARVDRLRLLGNGVVPLQAAYAFRTLATRLAGRGSAGATRLVRMMEPAA